MAAWQRNSHPPEYLSTIRPSKRTVLETPDSLHKLLPSGLDGSKVTPVFNADPQQHVTTSRSELAEAKDMAFLCERQDKEDKKGWTVHNMETCITDAEHECTAVGLMPILNAPAHEMDTVHGSAQMSRRGTGSGTGLCRRHR